MHICINCLNQHYRLMENDYRNSLSNFQKALTPNRPYIIEQQRVRLNYIYERELNQYNECQKFLFNTIAHDDRTMMAHFRPGQYLELKSNLERLNRTRMRFDHFFNQIQNLIDQYEGEENFDFSPSLPTVASEYGMIRRLCLPSRSICSAI